MKIVAVIYDQTFVKAGENGYWDFHSFRVGREEPFSEVPTMTKRTCIFIDLPKEEDRITAHYDDGTFEEIFQWNKIIYADEQAYTRFLPTSIYLNGEENSEQQEPGVDKDAV